MSITKKVYKIRDKTTGLFSMGGMSFRFNDKGKEWKKRQHVGSHITQSYIHYSSHNCSPANLEIVTYEVTMEEVNVESVAEIVKASLNRRTTIQARREKERAERNLWYKEAKKRLAQS